MEGSKYLNYLVKEVVINCGLVVWAYKLLPWPNLISNKISPFRKNPITYSVDPNRIDPSRLVCISRIYFGK